MKIRKTIKVPTGEIYVAQGEKGLLEFLTVGDYGKDANIKADFLGITRELNGVPNGKPMPLTEKWVITISTQYGCSMGCKFCDVPKVGAGRNATIDDLLDQVITAIGRHPEISHTKRLNIHYARMGEPTWNPDVIISAKRLPDVIWPYLGHSLIHPVVSTMLPKHNRDLYTFLSDWVYVKNEIYKGNAGLQFSINSTDDKQREYLFSGNSLPLEEIAAIGRELPMPLGRKYALNFALADNSIIDGKRLRELFDPEKFMCKITPLHRTASCEQNHIATTDGYELFTPYKAVEEDLKAHGFDVIVFVPSYDEDNGLITCGNAILSGKLPTSEYEIIEAKQPTTKTRDMERQIKFRGRNVHTGEWLYGDYHREGKTHYITKPGDYLREYAPIEFIVDAKTIGQFTGLLDKNGKEIYEGDIVKAPLLDPIFGDILSDAFDNAPIEFSNGSFVVSYYNGNRKIYIQDLFDKIEIIGNRFDTPSLISDKR